jgi:hypothetical protein
MSATATPTAADLAMLAEGSMTVKQAVEFSGLSWNRLFELMRDGVLPWFTTDTDNTRLMPCKPLVEYLALRGTQGAEQVNPSQTRRS